MSGESWRDMLTKVEGTGTTSSIDQKDLTFNMVPVVRVESENKLDGRSWPIIVEERTKR